MMQGREQRRLGADEAQARPGQTEELAQGAQHDQVGARGQGAQACFRGDVHEGLVDHQPATPGGQSGVPVQQFVLRKTRPGGVVGVDQHQNVAGFKDLFSDGLVGTRSSSSSGLGVEVT